MSSVERKLTLTPQCLLRVCDAEDVDVTSAPGTQGFHLGTRSFQVFTEARLKGSSPQRGFSDFLKGSVMAFYRLNRSRGNTGLHCRITLINIRG